MDLNLLKKRSKTLEPLLRIGKKGMTENVFIEIEKLLKKRDLVKIKILNNCPVDNKGALIDFIVEKSKSTLVEKVGNIFTIYRRKSSNKD